MNGTSPLPGWVTLDAFGPGLLGLRIVFGTCRSIAAQTVRTGPRPAAWRMRWSESMGTTKPHDAARWT
jgi:hypothetical protein